jgi:hypothetical protein
LSDAGRVRIEKALKNYQLLFIRAFQWPEKGTPQREIFDQDYKALLEGSKDFRNEISAT